MQGSALLHTDELRMDWARAIGAGHKDKMSILGKYLIILIDEPQRVSTTKDLPVE